MGNLRVGMLSWLAMLMLGCGTGGAPLAPQGPAPALSAGNQDDNRTLVFATRYEPVYISTRGFKSTAPGSTGPVIFDAGLTQTAGQGTPTELQLAEAFPELNTDTWKVSADGKMETTWKL